MRGIARTGTRRRRESGATSLEFLGIFLVVGTVVGAIALTVSSGRTSGEMASAFCSITGGQGCGDSGAAAPDASLTAARCVGAPSGAAGPVRGTVPLATGTGSDLAVSVMGDGTFRVSGAPDDATAAASWVGRTFGEAASGTEPFLAGGAPRVWSASSPADLASLVAGDRSQGWTDAVVGGDGTVARAADAVVGLASGDGLPAPDAVYTDLSGAAGLSLNAYEQVLALDAGGEALGVLDYADGSSTQYLGVDAPTTGTPRAADVVPTLLEVDRNPAGDVISVRTVTDRDVTTGGTGSPTGDLYVTHLDTTGGSGATAVAGLASAIGSTALGVPATNRLDGTPVPFSEATTALTSAATANGYVTRQQPAGTVTVDDPNADPVEAGLADVVRSSGPQAWDGTAWTPRATGCGS